MKSPKLRFKNFKDEYFIKKIQDVAEIKTGKKDTQNKISDGQYPFYVRSNTIERINSYSFDGESILTSGDGVGVGKNFHYINGKFDFHQRVYSIRNFKKSYDGKYIYFIFKEKFYDRVKRLSAKNSVDSVRMNMIADMKLAFPNYDEQKLVSSFIENIENRIIYLKEKKELLEQYKKGLMKKFFSQELRFKDDIGNDFPEWTATTLGEIGRFQTSSVDKLIRDNEQKVYLINYMNVYRHEKINNDSVKNFQVVTAKESQIESSNLKKGDILFTPSSETPSDIGHSVVIFEDLNNSVFSYHLMRFRPLIEIDTLFSHYFCNTSAVLNQLSKLSTGSTRFTISVKSFSTIKVQLPNIEEQVKIATFLKEIDFKINSVSKSVESTELWKKGLLQQMFV